MDEATPPTPKMKRVYCNRCKLETNHVERGTHRRADSGEHGFWDETVYTLWTCAGCDDGTMETAWTMAGMEDGEKQIYDFSYAPTRAEEDLSQKVFRQLPKQLKLIYGEAVSAYNHRLHVLSAAGLRALIEGICQDKKIKGKNLEQRIDCLETILPKNIVQNLHGFRFMGNEALHDLGAPDSKDLRLAIEVSEDLLNFLYELDYKASRLPKKAKPQPQEAS